MNRSDVCYLISVSLRNNEYGVGIQTEERTKRFCRVRSVSGSEFIEAGQQGIHAQYQIALLRAEYTGQQEVEYRGKRYSVYRVYERSVDTVELYVEERVGVG